MENYNELGVEVDMMEAESWFANAAEYSNLNAQLSLAQNCFGGGGVSQGLKKTICWFGNAQKKSAALAQLNAAKNLETSYAPIDEIVAAYHKAAEMGNAEAQCTLGHWYKGGNYGTDIDFDKSERWFRAAAKQGYTEAQYMLAVSLLGIVMYEEPFELFLRVPINGFDKKPPSFWFSFNYDCSQNQLKEAVYWLEVAAAQNYADAFFMMGACFFWGVGVQKSAKKALACFKKAAALNYADAICMVGFCYYEGFGVDCDTQTALEHLENAQQLGSRMANTMLLCISEYQRLADEGFGNMEPKRDDDDDLPF